MNTLSQPAKVIVIGDNNTIGNNNDINSRKRNSINTCNNCPKMLALKRKIEQLQESNKIKDILIEHLTDG